MERPGFRQRPSSRDEIARPSFSFKMSLGMEVATTVASHDFQLRAGICRCG